MDLDAKHGRTQPRSWMNLFWGLGGWWLAILLAVFLVFTVIAQSAINRADRFDAEGILAEAKVLELWTEIRRDSDGDRRTVYYVRYTFPKADGTPFTDSETIGSGTYRDLAVDDVIALRYLDQDPIRVEYPIGENRTSGRVLFIINWVLLVVLAGSFWWVGQKTNRGIKARRDGQAEWVEVTGTRRTNTRVNKRYRYRLTWRSEDGSTGESMMAAPEAFSAYEAGGQTVVYRRGSDAWWQGDVGPKA